MAKTAGPSYEPSAEELRRHVRQLKQDMSALDSRVATYRPVWQASSGTQLNIGNGVLNGTYQRFGPLCTVSILLRIGQGTQTGDPSALDLTYWVFSLPFAAALLTLGSAELRNYGVVGRVGVAKAFWEPGREQSVIVIPEQSGLPVGSDSPFTWGDQDELRLSLTYPVAGFGGAQTRATP